MLFRAQYELHAHHKVLWSFWASLECCYAHLADLLPAQGFQFPGHHKNTDEKKSGKKSEFSRDEKEEYVDLTQDAFNTSTMSSWWHERLPRRRLFLVGRRRLLVIRQYVFFYFSWTRLDSTSEIDTMIVTNLCRFDLGVFTTQKLQDNIPTQELTWYQVRVYIIRTLGRVKATYRSRLGRAEHIAFLMDRLA